MFLKDFAGKNQLPGFYISGTLVENGLIKYCLYEDKESLTTWNLEFYSVANLNICNK